MKKLLALLMALMMVLSVMTVAVFAEDTGNDSQEEGDDITVDDNQSDTAATPDEQNPHTGVALAVVPMMVAAAAAVVAKKH